MIKSCILGVTGQDGSFLAEKLLEKGHEVHGIIRRSSSFNTSRIDHIFDDLHLHYGDVSDPLNIGKIVKKVEPDYIYHLAAQSHVWVSFELPEYTGQVDALGTLRLLEAVRDHAPKCRVYNACTSELFGKVEEIPQTEKTPFHPRSPYGVAKIYSYWIARNYREAYDMFVSNGILFNHESERRGSTFVTKKITEALVKIKNGQQDILKLGNIDAKRDWGYAPDFVDGMIKIMEHTEPDDFVLSTNETHTVREFIQEAAKYVDMEIKWFGRGVEEVGFDVNTGKKIISIDSKYFRPAEVDLLLGDATKAKNILNWQPNVKFKELVKIMMEHELKTGGRSLMGT